MEHIIDRYMKEEIVASQKLKAPLPPLKDKASASHMLGVCCELAANIGSITNMRI